MKRQIGGIGEKIMREEYQLYWSQSTVFLTLLLVILYKQTQRTNTQTYV